MTPFDINPEHDAGHSIDQDDLIAFHLHELSSPQERAVHRVLHTNPSLQAESFAIASTLRAFPKHEPALPLDAAALDRHWQALRDSLPVHIPAAAPRRLFLPWSIPILATSAIAAALFLVSHYHHQPVQPPIVAADKTPSASVSTHPPSTTSGNSIAPFSSSTHSAITFASNAEFPPRQSNPSAINNPHPIPFAPIQPGASLSSPSIASSEPIPSTTTQLAATPTTLSSAIPPAPAPSSSSLPPSDQSAATANSSNSPHGRPSHGISDRTDLALSLEGSFASSATPGNSNFYRQNPAASAGGLVEFRHIAKPLLGWEVSYSFHRANQVYDELIETAGGVTSCATIACPVPTYAVAAYQHKFTADWVASAQLRSFRPFVLLGPGLLLTQPVSGQNNTATATEAAFDYGAGVDARLTRHLGLRLQYRGDLYRAPSIVPPNNTSPHTGMVHSSEPALGINYNF